jgi:hypothetical protein
MLLTKHDNSIKQLAGKDNVKDAGMLFLKILMKKNRNCIWYTAGQPAR